MPSYNMNNMTITQIKSEEPSLLTVAIYIALCLYVLYPEEEKPIFKETMLPTRPIWQFHNRRKSVSGVIKSTNLLRSSLLIVICNQFVGPLRTNLKYKMHQYTGMQIFESILCFFLFIHLAPTTQFNTSHPTEVHTERPENASKREIYSSLNGTLHQNQVRWI